MSHSPAGSQRMPTPVLSESTQKGLSLWKGEQAVKRAHQPFLTSYRGMIRHTVCRVPANQES